MKKIGRQLGKWPFNRSQKKKENEQLQLIDAGEERERKREDRTEKEVVLRKGERKRRGSWENEGYKGYGGKKKENQQL